MKKVFKGVISFNVKSSHPDIKYIVNANEQLIFDDTYTMDGNYFDNEEQMINFIKNDLALVASGGYSTEHIYNVKYDIERIA